jgi:hypothetical protein
MGRSSMIRLLVRRLVVVPVVVVTVVDGRRWRIKRVL